MEGVRLVFYFMYEVYIPFKFSWITVCIGTGAASYKRLVQVSPISSDFTEIFLYFFDFTESFLIVQCLSLLLKCLFCYRLI